MYTVVSKTFADNLLEVERLIDFDRDVLDILIGSLQRLRDEVPPQIHSFGGRIDRVIHIVSGIREHESLKTKYGAVCNQAVVLLVSHFSSALGDIFRVAVSDTLGREGNKELLDEELKLTFREIRDRNWDIKSAAGDLLIAKKDLMFQDMQSTVRAFHGYLGVVIEKDQRTNNIILGQAARHVIVHASARVTPRMLKQVAGAIPRSIKRELTADESLVFGKDEVFDLKSEMSAFIEDLVAQLENP